MNGIKVEKIRFALVNNIFKSEVISLASYILLKVVFK